MTAIKGGSTSNVPKPESGPVLILTPCHNSHDFVERRIAVPKSEEHAIKIGRAVGRVLAANNNAIFDCKVLSRNHALVWAEEENFLIKDTKSSNGTFINNSRLSNSGEESAATTLATGDILQLGVEIVDNTKKVASGCIVAMVRFLNEKGEEIPPNRSLSNGTSHSTTIVERIPKHCLVVPEEQMYQMQHYIYEAKHRESTLSQKLLLLQDALRTAQNATEMNWEAMINEDRLLARIEVLEDQLMLCANKNLTPTELKEKIDDYFEQRKKVETMTKDLLRKSNQEASETRQRLQEVELALMNVEDHNTFLKKQMNDLEREYAELKYEMEKLSGDYDVVCHELELSKATNQHLILTAQTQANQIENSPPVVSSDEVTIATDNETGNDVKKEISELDTSNCENVLPSFESLLENRISSDICTAVSDELRRTSSFLNKGFKKGLSSEEAIFIQETIAESIVKATTMTKNSITAELLKKTDKSNISNDRLENGITGDGSTSYDSGIEVRQRSIKSASDSCDHNETPVQKIRIDKLDEYEFPVDDKEANIIEERIQG